MAKKEVERAAAEGNKGSGGLTRWQRAQRQGVAKKEAERAVVEVTKKAAAESTSRERNGRE